MGYELVKKYRGYEIYYFPPNVNGNGYYLVMEGWDFHQIPFNSIKEAEQFCDERDKLLIAAWEIRQQTKGETSEL